MAYIIIPIAIFLIGYIISRARDPRRKFRKDIQNGVYNNALGVLRAEKKEKNKDNYLPFTLIVEKVLKHTKHEVYVVGLVRDGILREGDKVLITLNNGQVIESEIGMFYSKINNEGWQYPGDKAMFMLRDVNKFNLNAAIIRKSASANSYTFQTYTQSNVNNTNKKFCRFCGASMDVNSKFCPKCGAQN